MSTKKLSFGNAILCEHVIIGQNNKVTMINAYAGDIRVSAFPAKLLFGFYSEYLAEADFDERHVTLEIRIDGKEYARVEVAIKDARAGLPAIIAVPVFELGADKAMSIEFYAIAEGFARTRIMRKMISDKPITSSAPQPPSSRSLSVARGKGRRL